METMGGSLCMGRGPCSVTSGVCAPGRGSTGTRTGMVGLLEIWKLA